MDWVHVSLCNVESIVMLYCKGDWANDTVHALYVLVFSVPDAFGYINFILKSIQSKELFNSLDITTTGCWEYLLWLDQVLYNCEI